MTLSIFIKENMDAIVQEWLEFAMTMEPAASTMSAMALRDHARPILLAIARDLESSQTDRAQEDKSKGWGPALSTRETAAATHGALRQVSGFDLNQLGAEYRALRASVIRLWMRSRPLGDRRRHGGGHDPLQRGRGPGRRGIDVALRGRTRAFARHVHGYPGA